MKGSAISLISIEVCTLEKTPLVESCILLFGQEGPGLSPEALTAADQVIEITQFGSTRSINASAAAAIVMHQWVMQHADLDALRNRG